ncbi:hypothetical protein [Viridibacillus arvi]|uniref:hypothetical protein n=1 Tax=Viridibacillus arvi TaxID=263475 RepID=UPI003D034E48
MQNDNWLNKLKERPDLAPDPKFIQSLRNRVIAHKKTSKKNTYLPIFVMTSVISILAILIILTLPTAEERQTLIYQTAGESCANKEESKIVGSWEVIGKEERALYRVSDQHKNKIVKHRPMTFSEVNELLYDEKNQYGVEDFAGYNIGDTITIRDVVRDITYDDDQDISKVKFNTHQNAYTLLVFKGDVRSRIEVNGRFTFYFKVVPLIDCFEYETLEIVRKWEGGEYPTINEYLIKKN